MDGPDDEPMTLDAACRELFRNAIRPATLRAEAARGNLTIERIGRRDFVTRAAIREMREKCRQAPPQKDLVSGSSRSAAARADRRRQPDGSSEMTEDSSVAFRSALKTVAALKERSRTTSRKNTRSLPANVVPIGG